MESAADHLVFLQTLLADPATQTLAVDVQHWLRRDPDPAAQTELRALLTAKNLAELRLRFDGRLAFGTAGLRAEVGCGSTRMNRLVVRETTAGLAAVLLQSVPNAAQRGVLLSYDGRLDSKQFAEDTACVLAALGIQVFLTEDVAATPIAAFGLLQLNAAAAVVVTASHNPPSYNGYKVYWQNGAQIIPPQDSDIAEAIDRAAQAVIPWVEYAAACTAGAIDILGEPFYRSYRDAVLSASQVTGAQKGADIAIAYTPLHGVGATMAESLLGAAGFDRVYTVAAQREPDGSFPTVRFPNPEEPGAMDAVIALAKERGATLACANDPDADRLAVAARNASGDYVMLSGDQVGALLGHYLLQLEALQGSGHTSPLLGTTIVSSRLLAAIAEANGAEFYQTLTGFKWLANAALNKPDGDQRFLFAYEEALGYCIGPLVRDKDGLSALLVFAQMTAALEARGETVFSQLEVLYRQHGLYLTRQCSIATAPGVSVGEALRHFPPREIAGIEVVYSDDVQLGVRRYADGREEALQLPVSDVLIYNLSNRARVIVRPSGTEPKLKCYYEIIEAIAAEETFDRARERGELTVAALVAAHQQAIAKLL